MSTPNISSQLQTDLNSLDGSSLLTDSTAQLKAIATELKKLDQFNSASDLTTALANAKATIPVDPAVVKSLTDLQAGFAQFQNDNSSSGQTVQQLWDSYKSVVKANEQTEINQIVFTVIASSPSLGTNAAQVSAINTLLTNAGLDPKTYSILNQSPADIVQAAVEFALSANSGVAAYQIQNFIQVNNLLPGSSGITDLSSLISSTLQADQLLSAPPLPTAPPVNALSLPPAAADATPTEVDVATLLANTPAAKYAALFAFIEAAGGSTPDLNTLEALGNELDADGINSTAGLAALQKAFFGNSPTPTTTFQFNLLLLSLSQNGYITIPSALRIRLETYVTNYNTQGGFHKGDQSYIDPKGIPQPISNVNTIIVNNIYAKKIAQEIATQIVANALKGNSNVISGVTYSNSATFVAMLTPFIEKGLIDTSDFAKTGQITTKDIATVLFNLSNLAEAPPDGSGKPKPNPNAIFNFRDGSGAIYTGNTDTDVAKDISKLAAQGTTFLTLPSQSSTNSDGNLAGNVQALLGSVLAAFGLQNDLNSSDPQNSGKITNGTDGFFTNTMGIFTISPIYMLGNNTPDSSLISGISATSKVSYTMAQIEQMEITFLNSNGVLMTQGATEAQISAAINRLSLAQLTTLLTTLGTRLNISPETMSTLVGNQLVLNNPEFQAIIGDLLQKLMQSLTSFASTGNFSAILAKMRTIAGELQNVLQLVGGATNADRDLKNKNQLITQNTMSILNAGIAIISLEQTSGNILQSAAQANLDQINYNQSVAMQIGVAIAGALMTIIATTIAILTGGAAAFLIPMCVLAVASEMAGLGVQLAQINAQNNLQINFSQLNGPCPDANTDPVGAAKWNLKFAAYSQTVMQVFTNALIATGVLSAIFGFLSSCNPEGVLSAAKSVATGLQTALKIVAEAEEITTALAADITANITADMTAIGTEETIGASTKNAGKVAENLSEISNQLGKVAKSIQKTDELDALAKEAFGPETEEATLKAAAKKELLQNIKNMQKILKNAASDLEKGGDGLSKSDLKMILDGVQDIQQSITKFIVPELTTALTAATEAVDAIEQGTTIGKVKNWFKTQGKGDVTPMGKMLDKATAVGEKFATQLQKELEGSVDEALAACRSTNSEGVSTNPELPENDFDQGFKDAFLGKKPPDNLSDEYVSGAAKGTESGLEKAKKLTKEIDAFNKEAAKSEADFSKDGLTTVWENSKSYIQALWKENKVGFVLTIVGSIAGEVLQAEASPYSDLNMQLQEKKLQALLDAATNYEAQLNDPSISNNPTKKADALTAYQAAVNQIESDPKYDGSTVTTILSVLGSLAQMIGMFPMMSRVSHMKDALVDVGEKSKSLTEEISGTATVFKRLMSIEKLTEQASEDGVLATRLEEAIQGFKSNLTEATSIVGAGDKSVKNAFKKLDEDLSKLLNRNTKVSEGTVAIAGAADAINPTLAKFLGKLVYGLMMMPQDIPNLIQAIYQTESSAAKIKIDQRAADFTALNLIQVALKEAVALANQNNNVAQGNTSNGDPNSSGVSSTTIIKMVMEMVQALIDLLNTLRQTTSQLNQTFSN